MTTENPQDDPIQPDVVDSDEEQEDEEGPSISQPTKLIRMASMTRAMLEEVRQAPTDEPGRRRLLEIHERSLDQLRGVISDGLRQELDEIFLPLANNEATPSESEIRIAQAQLVGWLEGLFHGIQASIASQQMAAQAQLQQMQQRRLRAPAPEGEDPNTGLYL